MVFVESIQKKVYSEGLEEFQAFLKAQPRVIEK